MKLSDELKQKRASMHTEMENLLEASRDAFTEDQQADFEGL